MSLLIISIMFLSRTILDTSDHEESTPGNLSDNKGYYIMYDKVYYNVR